MCEKVNLEVSAKQINQRLLTVGLALICSCSEVLAAQVSQRNIITTSNDPTTADPLLPPGVSLTLTHPSNQPSYFINSNNDAIDQLLDAFKYYHLNRILHKTAPSGDCNHNNVDSDSVGGHENQGVANDGISVKSGARELNPLEGGVSRFSPRDGRPTTKQQDSDLEPGLPREPSSTAASDESGGSGDEDDNSMDHPIRAMKESSGRRDQGQVGVAPKTPPTSMVKHADADDDSSSSPAEVARLRSRVMSVPRRKRRASMRQAPPKLKSRRVSRNSRRRKLRHGIKPKRRA